MQTMVKLALKGYCLPKIGQLVNKTHSTVQYIVNKFKYSESIKNKPTKPKRIILSARQESFVLGRIRKKKILG